MPLSAGHYSDGPEVLVVSLAIRGDREAFAELVRRRQTWVRTLLRRCCGDATLADDLSQQVFLQAWRKIRQVKDETSFGAWIKRMAINEWLQHARKKDALRHSDSDVEDPRVHLDTTSVAMDLDTAMAELPGPVSLCIALSYHEKLTHAEIEALTQIPVGTVKSHIRRGSEKLRQLLSAYGDDDAEDENE